MLKVEEFFSERAVTGLVPSAIRELIKYSSDPAIISLGGGFPDPRLFPTEKFNEAMDHVLRTVPNKALQYGTTEGVKELREWLINYEKEEEKINLDLEEVIITIGSQQSFDLFCKVLLDPKDIVLVEEPSYVGALTAFKAFHIDVVPIPMDDDGMIMEALESKCQELAKINKKAKLIYVIPNFQNPAGVTMSLVRRKKILEIAQKYNLLIVEDNPYGDLIFEGEKLPPIKYFDTEGRVIYIRTFSKILFPGLRLGWFMGNKELVRKIVIAKQSSDLCTTSLGQFATYEYCRRGYLKPHVEYMAKEYAKKRDAMIEAIKLYFPPDIKYTYPHGGFFVWLTLPENMSANDMFMRAIDNKVAYVVGSAFHIDGRGKNTIRLSFSQVNEAEIKEAIRRLGEVLYKEIDLLPLKKAASE